MRLGLSSAAFYGRMETEDQAAYLTSFPVGCCEVFLQTPSEYTADFGALVRSRLGDIPCVSVHPKGTQFEWDLFGRSGRQVEDAFSTFTGVCQAGQALGARYYVLHGPAGVSVPLEPGRIHCLQETMARMQGIAAAHGMEVLWENVSWCAIRRPEDVAAVKELLPRQRFVLDVKQAFRAGQDPVAMLRAMGESVAHVHVLDHTADGELFLPGEGVVDWQGIAAQLREIGYEGAVILEPYERQARDEAALRRSLAYLTSLLQLQTCACC